MSMNNLDGCIVVRITFPDLNADFDVDIPLSLLCLDEDEIKEDDEGTIHQAIYDYIRETPRDIDDYEIHLEEEEEEEDEDEDEDEGEED